jgi:hypothetical protein
LACEGRLATAFAIAVLAAVAVARSADAALSFGFDRASARPGLIVVASQPGWSSAADGVTIDLVPTRRRGVQPDAAGSYILRRPPVGAIRLGRPRLTRSQLLLIRSRVPRLAPGDYTTAFWCRTCAESGDFFASALWGATATGRPGPVLRITR